MPNPMKEFSVPTRKEVNSVEYSKPELILAGQADSVVLGSGNPTPGDPGPPGTTSLPAVLEFED